MDNDSNSPVKSSRNKIQETVKPRILLYSLQKPPQPPVINESFDHFKDVCLIEKTEVENFSQNRITNETTNLNLEHTFDDFEFEENLFTQEICKDEDVELALDQNQYPEITESDQKDDNLVISQEIEESAQASAIFGKDLEVSPKISGLLSTAGGNPLKISEKCLSKAQDIFGEDLEDLPLKSHNMVQKIQSSATPAEEKSLTISNNCLSETKDIFDKDLLPFASLTTAGGKSLTFSNDCVSKAQSIFGEDLDDLVTNDEKMALKRELPGSSSVEEKSLSISNDCLLKAQDMLGEDLEDWNLKAPKEEFSQLKPVITTAAGKPLSISNDCLSKVQDIFGEDLDDLPLKSHKMSLTRQNPELQHSVSLRTAGGKSLAISNDYVSKAKGIFGEDLNDLVTNEVSKVALIKEIPGSLTTAGGKSLTIGIDCLSKARDIFGEDLDNLAINDENITKMPPKGVFSKPVITTAGGKSLTISSDCLSKAQDIFGEDFEDLETKEEEILKMVLKPSLTSAGGKSLPTAKSYDFFAEDLEWESLEKYPLKMPHKQEIPKLETTETFTTAIGKSLTISNESLAKVCNIFGEDLNDLVCKEISEAALEKKLPESLTTAGGKPLSISNDCLAKAQNILGEDLDDLPIVFHEMALKRQNPELKPSVVLLTTEGGKSLIREEDLPDLSIKETPKVSLKRKMPDFKNTLEALATAGGKSLDISNDCLMKAQDIFGEDFKDLPFKSHEMPLKRKHTDPLATPSSDKKSSKLPLRRPLFELNASVVNSSNPKRKSDSQLENKSKKLATEIEMLKIKQSEIIKNKSKNPVPRSMGSLYKAKMNKKFKLSDLKICRETKFIITPQNASSFNFKISSNEDLNGFELIPNENQLAGLLEISNSFLASEGVDPKLISNKWIKNHYKWIIWKLASMENFFQQNFLTPKNVLLQLKYRYDREIDRVERSAFKKILECDEPAGRRFICCVSNIKIEESAELELTDGWYSVWAICDDEMMAIVRKNLVKIGTKLIISGAEFNGKGCDPLNVPDNVRLRVHTNSIRRAKWDTKMGFVKTPSPFVISMASIKAQGGMIGCFKAFVESIFPILYMYEDEKGSKVFRNARAHALESKKLKEQKTKKAEEFFETELKELEKHHQIIFSTKKKNYKNLNEIDDEESLYSISTNDDTVSLSSSQLELVKKYKEEKLNCINQQVVEKLNSEFPDRQPKALFRVRLLEPTSGKTAILTFWNPNFSLSRGFMYRFYQFKATGTRDGTLHLSSTKNSKHLKENACLDSSYSRKVTKFSEIDENFNPKYGDVDIVGIVIEITMASNGVTNVILCDLNKNFVKIVFWASLDKFGCDDIITEGSAIAVANLQWRKISRRSKIPSLFVSDMTYVTLNPQDDYTHLKTALKYCNDELKLKDIKLFLNEQKIIWHDIGDKNDFDCVKINTNERTPVRDRIAKLSRYGTPPPLGTPTVTGIKNLAKPFKSPMTPNYKK